MQITKEQQLRLAHPHSKPILPKLDLFNSTVTTKQIMPFVREKKHAYYEETNS